MSPKRAALTAVSLAATLVGAAGSASSATPVARTLWTTGTVSSIAADGPRVAVATANLPKQCDRVVVWSPLVRRQIAWSAGSNCPAGKTSGGQALLDVALAGTRVAWLEAVAGNDQDLTLRTASLVGVKKAKSIAFAENGNGAGGDPEGAYLGNLYGDGTLLGFNSWVFCDDHTGVELPPRPPCTVTTKGVIAQKLVKVSATAAQTTIRTGATALPLLAVDAGRFLVVDGPGGNATLVDAAGHLLRTISTTPGTVGGAGLNGRQIAVLTGRTIHAYDTTTGASTRSVVAIGPAPTLTDLQSGIAVYTTGRQVRLVRLSDGRDRLAATAPSALAGAQLESAGLWFAYNLASGKTRGRVVYLPWASVLAKLR